MTTEQILQEVANLPRGEQEAVARAIVTGLAGVETQGDNGPGRETPEQRRAKRRAAVKRLDGALRWPGPPPTDDEVEQMRDEYLTQKYQ